MINIDFSHSKFKFKTEAKVDFIFDNIRKKWIVITPEEWVRQNFIQYLTNQLNYPPSLFAIEKELEVNGQKKRFDIVIYKNGKAWMIVECKQVDVVINDRAMQQILSYNTTINAEYFVITNGKETFCWQKKEEEIFLKEALPSWN